MTGGVGKDQIGVRALNDYFNCYVLQPLKPRSVACPRCGASVVWTAAERWRPFCSERCKLIDFGAWASEAYRVPTAEAPEIETEPPPDDHSPDRS